MVGTPASLQWLVLPATGDPLQQPKIVANAYSTEADVAEMLDAVKFLRRLAAMPAMPSTVRSISRGTTRSSAGP